MYTNYRGEDKKMENESELSNNNKRVKDDDEMRAINSLSSDSN